MEMPGAAGRNEPSIYLDNARDRSAASEQQSLVHGNRERQKSRFYSVLQQPAAAAGVAPAARCLCTISVALGLGVGLVITIMVKDGPVGVAIFLGLSVGVTMLASVIRTWTSSGQLPHKANPEQLPLHTPLMPNAGLTIWAQSMLRFVCLCVHGDEDWQTTPQEVGMQAKEVNKMLFWERVTRTSTTVAWLCAVLFYACTRLSGEDLDLLDWASWSMCAHKPCPSSWHGSRRALGSTVNTPTVAQRESPNSNWHSRWGHAHARMCRTFL